MIYKHPYKKCIEFLKITALHKAIATSCPRPHAGLDFLLESHDHGFFFGGAKIVIIHRPMEYTSPGGVVKMKTRDSYHPPGPAYTYQGPKFKRPVQADTKTDGQEG